MGAQPNGIRTNRRSPTGNAGFPRRSLSRSFCAQSGSSKMKIQNGIEVKKIHFVENIVEVALGLTQIGFIHGE
jgi:hypothetical protein